MDMGMVNQTFNLYITPLNMHREEFFFSSAQMFTFSCGFFKKFRLLKKLLLSFHDKHNNYCDKCKKGSNRKQARVVNCGTDFVSKEK